MPESELLPALFAQLLFFKERQSDSLMEKSKSLFRSSAHKKQAILMTNQRAKSKLCL